MLIISASKLLAQFMVKKELQQTKGISLILPLANRFKEGEKKRKKT
jgi:hypothetical protein